MRCAESGQGADGEGCGAGGAEPAGAGERLTGSRCGAGPDRAVVRGGWQSPVSVETLEFVVPPSGPAPVPWTPVSPGAGVRAGRRPPEGLGLDAGEDEATLGAREPALMRRVRYGRRRAGRPRARPGTACPTRSGAGCGCTPRSRPRPDDGPGPGW